MRKNILFLTSRDVEEAPKIEKALGAVGFETLRVDTLKDALHHVSTEIFCSIICVDTVDGSLQRALMTGLADQPLGAVTPVVVLGKGKEPKGRAALVSILDQYFPLSTDPSVIAEFCRETHALRSEKTKRGLLSATISVPQVLQQASRLRLNGGIGIERGDEKCIIYLENGIVVFSSSNRDENRFGEFLVQQGIISENAFARATKRLQETQQRFGRILVEEGVIKPEALPTLLALQVKHIIYSVFDWTDGEFYILFDEGSGQKEAVAEFEVNALVLEGIRFTFSEEKLDWLFAPHDQKVSLAMSLKEAQQSFRLGKNEVDFLKIVGPGKPIGELLRLSFYNRAESLKLLYAFKVLGLLTFETVEISRPEASAPPRDEKTEVVEESVESEGASVVQEPTPSEVPSWPEEPSHTSKRNWVVYSFFAAGTVFVLLGMITFVNFRALRSGVPTEARLPEAGTTPVPPEAVVAVAIPTVAPSPPANPPPAATAPEVVSAPTEPTPIVETTKVPEVAAVVPAAPKIKESLDERFQKLISTAAHQRKSRQPEKALPTYRRALALKPKNVNANLAVGEILLDLERFSEAKAAFETVVGIDPSHPQPYLALGTIHLMEDNKAKAASMLRKYLTVEKRTPQTLPRITEVQKILQSLEANR